MTGRAHDSVSHLLSGRSSQSGAEAEGKVLAGEMAGEKWKLTATVAHGTRIDLWTHSSSGVSTCRQWAAHRAPRDASRSEKIRFWAESISATPSREPGERSCP